MTPLAVVVARAPTHPCRTFDNGRASRGFVCFAACTHTMGPFGVRACGNHRRARTCPLALTKTLCGWFTCAAHKGWMNLRDKLKDWAGFLATPARLSMFLLAMDSIIKPRQPDAIKLPQDESELYVCRLPHHAHRREHQRGNVAT